MSTLLFMALVASTATFTACMLSCGHQGLHDYLQERFDQDQSD